MYYYYKIENITNKKSYIGITTNINARKNKHFSELRKNQHFNPHLQKAFNLYGEQNFIFSIIETKENIEKEEAYNHEIYLISKFKTQNPEFGYNCNPGGQITGSGGQFKKQEIYFIKSVLKLYPSAGCFLAKYYNCSRGAINDIKIGRSYKLWGDEFDSLSEEEKQKNYDNFLLVSQLDMTQFGTKQYLRKMSKEQIFTVLLNQEFKFTSYAKLRRAFGLKDDHRYVFADVRKGTTYKDFYNEYNQFTEKEKNDMLCHYRAIYN